MDREAGYNLGAISAGGISVHRTAIVQIDDGSKTYYAGVRVLSSSLLCGKHAERRDFYRRHRIIVQKPTPRLVPSREGHGERQALFVAQWLSAPISR
jgi:hypothetical protein